MKKPLFCIMVGILLTMKALASPTGEKMGDQISVPIQKPDEDVPDGRPRVPALSLFTAFVDTDLNILFVSSRFDLGDVYAIVENLSTGDYVEYSFDSSETAILPISGTSGFWRITLTLESGVGYVGDFSL